MGLRIQALLVSAATTFCSVGALALGLGEIKLNSALNQPLNAEIQLLQVKDLPEERINVSLASREEFERLGVERPSFLNDLKFSVDLNAPGGPVVRITSLKPVREPFLDFVINARWPSGKLLREYTLLVDLPVFTGNQTSAAPPPAPAQVSRPAAPKPVEQAPVPARQAPVPAAPAAPAAPATPAAPDTTAGAAGQYGPVSGNDTLWGIAAGLRPDESVTVQQTMLAIQRLNPDAFINNNINLIRRGQVLRVPSKEEIERLTANQAAQEVGSQNRAWSDRSQPAAAAPQLSGSKLSGETRSESKQAQGRVKLSSPVTAQEGASNPSGAGEGEGTSGLENQLTVAQEQLDAATRENEELRSRVRAMEEQVETMERLVAVSSEEMRALELVAQKTNDEKARQAAAAEAVARQEQTGNAAGESNETAEVANADAETPVSEAQPQAPATQASSQVSAPRSAPQQQKSWFDLLLDNMLFFAIGLAALVAAVAGWLFLRKRDDGFDYGDDEFGDLSDFDYEEDDVDQPTVTAAPAGVAAGRLNEELEPKVVPRLAEAETEDVVAESDIHIAYGQFDQAEEKLLRALEKEPHDANVRLKLMEVYAAQNDVQHFDQQYAQLLPLGNAKANERAERMRNSLDGAAPSNARASSAAGLGAAVASGAAVDLGATQQTHTADLAAALDFSERSLEDDFNQPDESDELGTSSFAEEDTALFAPTDYDLELDFEEDRTEIAYPAESVVTEDTIETQPSTDYDLELDFEEDKTEIAVPARSVVTDDTVETASSVEITAEREDLSDLEFDLDDEGFDFDLGDIDLDLAEEGTTAAVSEPQIAEQKPDTTGGDLELGTFEVDEGFAADWSEFDTVTTAPASEPVKAAEPSALDIDFSSLDLDRTLETAAVTEDDLDSVADTEASLDLEAIDPLAEDELGVQGLSATTVRPAIDFEMGADEALPRASKSDVSQPDYAGINVAPDRLEDDISGDENVAASDLSLDDLDEGFFAEDLDATAVNNVALDLQEQSVSDAEPTTTEYPDLSDLDFDMDEPADLGDGARDTDAEEALELTVVEEVSDSDAPFAQKARSGWDDIEEADFTELSAEDIAFSEPAVDSKPKAAAPKADLYAVSQNAEYEIPDFDPESDDDSELDFLSDADETSTKLDLARAYIDMGDADGARDILGEVIDEGSQDQRQQAKTLLARLG